MIISAKLIRNPRKLRRCEACHAKINPGTHTLRLFGMADIPDPPYVIYVHAGNPKCYGDDPKTLKALERRPNHDLLVVRRSFQQRHKS